MLSFFKKLFAKPKPAPAKALAAPPPVEPSAPLPGVEVAHLSLAAILSRLPDDIKALVRQEPTATATVALPLPTIMKQLPTGCVKMSLATLHRQAHGIFAPLPGGDKRTVEVPLAEIFRHVNPRSFRRRADQRAVYVPESAFSLFGNAGNPHEIAPASPGESIPNDSTVLDLTQEMPRVLRMDEGSRIQLSTRVEQRPPPASGSPAGGFRLEKTPPPPHVNGGRSPAADLEPAAGDAHPHAPESSEAPLVLPLAVLAVNWPETIRGELAGALETGAQVALPCGDVAKGLAKGRVLFTWGQIRSWITPETPAPGEADESTPLILPLKIVAPAFLSASQKAKAPRKSLLVDESIPSLFTDGKTLPPPPEPAAPALILAETHAPLAEAGSRHDEAPSASGAAEPQKIPQSVGEVFGNPHQLEWTPGEIVQNTVRLPGVAGAVVALQEGLQVASSLPEGVKSDVVAAFLPQIFARLNQYAGEMKLGEVDDLLFTTHGAHCQIYRLGYVYFAVLGRPGEALPWHELRLVSEELARQTRK